MKEKDGGDEGPVPMAVRLSKISIKDLKRMIRRAEVKTWSRSSTDELIHRNDHDERV